MTLSVQAAKKFFGSLYNDRSHAMDLGHFEAAALRLVARVETEEAVATKDVAAGDKALAVLMLNHIMNSANLDQPKKAALSAAALLNIKADLVARFTELFPNMNVEELSAAAKRAGYHVEVLEPRAAAAMPRSVIGR